MMRTYAANRGLKKRYFVLKVVIVRISDLQLDGGVDRTQQQARCEFICVQDRRFPRRRARE